DGILLGLGLAQHPPGRRVDWRPIGAASFAGGDETDGFADYDVLLVGSRTVPGVRQRGEGHQLPPTVEVSTLKVVAHAHIGGWLRPAARLVLPPPWNPFQQPGLRADVAHLAEVEFTQWYAVATVAPSRVRRSPARYAVDQGDLREDEVVEVGEDVL